MESHDLNSDSGLEALLSGSKPAPLPDYGFSERVVAQIPAKPRIDWASWIVALTAVGGTAVVVRDPVNYAQLEKIAQNLPTFLSSWSGLGLAFAAAVCFVALFGNPLNEESRD